MIATRGFLTAVECTKSVFGRGSAPDPAGGAHNAPPGPLVGWGGDTPPHSPPPRRVRRLGLVACGDSFPKPPPKFFSGYVPAPIIRLRTATTRTEALANLQFGRNNIPPQFLIFGLNVQRSKSDRPVEISNQRRFLGGLLFCY